MRAARRSQHRFHDLFASLREALAEHWWMKAVVAALVLYVAVAPPLWIYRDRIEQKLGFLPLPSKKIVVVLPFKVTGDNLSLSYIDGLTDSLTATLNQLAPRVQIVPASDVRSAAISTGNEARKNFGANLALFNDCTYASTCPTGGGGGGSGGTKRGHKKPPGPRQH